MNTRRPDKDDLFHAAAELQNPVERAAFLADACRGDSQLRAEIEDLLDHDQKAGSFLAVPAVGAAPTLDAPMVESPGTIIGKYKLLQGIGEGGMGSVYMAEQTEPVKRRVALKIIKPGMDSKQVIARFEVERQALAMMDHPNIAKVLDAGTTDSGRPYFVMELVKGVPITMYCDEHHATPYERLKLFTSVCLAVQHAHQKGVVHRDLKPSNVLVAHYDSQPVVKVIDFGVAKAMGQQLTEKTLFTQFGQVVGTLEYMSPEQARFNQLDIDTRSDVYSLGVLLYELLTGVTPFDRERLQTAAFDEVMRIIREEEPPKPSTRVSMAKSESSMTADRCNTEPGKLSSMLRGDLDWLVMKALAKDRDRRYETASSLAADIDHYLNREPIDARAPSSMYRLRKLASRHRAFLVATGLVMGALIAGIVASTHFAVGQSRERRRAEDARLEAETLAAEADRQREALEKANSRLSEAFLREAIAEAMAGNYAGMEERIAQLPETYRTWGTMLRALAAQSDGRPQEAVELLESVVKAEPQNVAAQGMLADAYFDAGVLEKFMPTHLSLMDMSATDDFDVLFKAVGEALFSPRTSVRSLSELVHRRPSWALAHAMLARAKLYNAWETDSLEEAIAASELAATVRTLLPKVPSVARTELLAQLCVAKILERHNAPHADWLQRADKTARYLQTTFPPRSCFLELAAYYATDARRSDEAIAMLRGVIIDGAGSMAQNIYHAMLFEAGRSDDAVGPLSPAMFPAKLEASQTAEDRLAIVSSCREYNAKPDVPRIERLYVQLSLYVCGERAEALREWKRMLEDDEDLLWNEEYALRLFAGQWDSDRILAAAGESGQRRAVAHYLIAHKSLYMDGDRRMAEKHFQACLDCCVIGPDFPHWAKAYLTKLKDPDWPHWLPKAPSSPSEAQLIPGDVNE